MLIPVHCRRLVISPKMLIPAHCRSGTRLANISRKAKLYNVPRINYSTPSLGKEYPFKKYSKLFIYGLGVVSAVAGSYIYFRTPFEKEEKPAIIPDVDTVPKKYVDPDLDEKLALLEEYGAIPYLIIGSGAAAFSALRAIRVNDPTSKILIVGEEPFYPYIRPPLSKEVWFSDNPNITTELKFKQWSGRERSLFLEREEFYCSVKDLLLQKNGGISVLRGVKVVHIDPAGKFVFLDNGKSITYKKCLIATGGRPKSLPVVENLSEDVKENVTLFRTIEDFQNLHRIVKRVQSITIVGGGFLGSELACALGRSGKQVGLEVTQVFPESGIMGKAFPKYLSDWSTEKIRMEGVTVIPDTTIKSIKKVNKKVHVDLTNGQNVVTDHVIVAVGSEPNTELAKDAGLEIDEHHGGFVVNAELEARKDLWVAGDAACFYDLQLGRRRAEHHDHAMISGRLAGENMTGLGNPFYKQPMFWSDLGPYIGYEAIGIIDSSLPTVGVFVKNTANNVPASVVETTSEPTSPEHELLETKPKTMDLSTSSVNKDLDRGIVFYLRDNVIVGIILWNVFTKTHIARKVINEAKQNSNLVEVAKLFNLNENFLED